MGECKCREWETEGGDTEFYECDACRRKREAEERKKEEYQGLGGMG